MSEAAAISSSTLIPAYESSSLAFLMMYSAYSRKNIYLCFIDYAKAFVWIITNCEKLLKRWEYQTILPVYWETCLWVKKQQLEPCMELLTGFKIEKGVQQGCLLPPCLFNLYAEHVMRKAGLDELQFGIKIGGRNVKNLRHVDHTTLMAESEEELKSLLMRVKEESERAGLRWN